MSANLEDRMHGRRERDGVLKIPHSGRGLGYLTNSLTPLTLATGVIVNLLAYNIARTQLVQISTLAMAGFFISVTLSIGAVAFTLGTLTLRLLARKENRRIGEKKLGLQNEANS